MYKIKSKKVKEKSESYEVKDEKYNDWEKIGKITKHKGIWHKKGTSKFIHIIKYSNSKNQNPYGNWFFVSDDGRKEFDLQSEAEEYAKQYMEKH